MVKRWPRARRQRSESPPDRGSTKGLRQFLHAEQQRAWLEGETTLPGRADRTESLEHRFKYAARFEKLLRRPQARDVLDVLRLYGTTCIPIPRRTERTYWSVSCLPSTSDQPLVRVNARWMELFALLPDSPSPLAGEGRVRWRTTRSTLRSADILPAGRQPRRAFSLASRSLSKAMFSGLVAWSWRRSSSSTCVISPDSMPFSSCTSRSRSSCQFSALTITSVLLAAHPSRGPDRGNAREFGRNRRCPGSTS
jgi:hypothetical protein